MIKMYVRDERNKQYGTPFGNLTTGQSFEYEGSIHIKVSYDLGFDLENEELCDFDYGTQVVQVNLDIAVRD